VAAFKGYHSEWNLGSPGGWDYQRLTQAIGKAVWKRLNELGSIDLVLDLDHSFFSPVDSFAELLTAAHRKRAGNKPGLIAVVAEEETLADVTENRNFAELLDTFDGFSGALMAPQEIELQNNTVCWQGKPISIIFMDFNTDVLLKLHRKHNLHPVLKAVEEGRVINPRGTEPFNVKSMFEVITGPLQNKFHQEIVRRTPWTRQFYSRETNGPGGEDIRDLIEWTRTNWADLVLKPERGYSGHGVRVGAINDDVEEAINLALDEGNYIVQEKIPLNLWAEDIPLLEENRIKLKRYQTDFRCLMGPSGLMGFVGRFGGVPTNVGSGGGFQPLAMLKSDVSVREAVNRINDAIMRMDPGDLADVIEMQEKMAMDCNFTYLLGPVRIALRPRVITTGQVEALKNYGRKLWSDCLVLEEMWLAGEFDDMVKIEPAELEITKMNPWKGSSAIIASDGLFSFGAEPRDNYGNRH
jgi:hypothetical protein